MKKLLLLIPPLIVLSSFSLTGCDNKDNSSYKNLEERVKQLEQQVATLNKTLTEQSAEHSDAASTGHFVDTSDSTSKNLTSDTTESLTKAVDEITAKADSAVPNGNTEEKRAQFFNLKDELHLTDQRLDSYDDYIESQYKQGQLSYEDYRSQAQILENLEDKLDASEDKLEQTFGIDA